MCNFLCLMSAMTCIVKSWKFYRLVTSIILFLKSEHSRRTFVGIICIRTRKKMSLWQMEVLVHVDVTVGSCKICIDGRLCVLCCRYLRRISWRLWKNLWCTWTKLKVQPTEMSFSQKLFRSVPKITTSTSQTLNGEYWTLVQMLVIVLLMILQLHRLCNIQWRMTEFQGGNDVGGSCHGLFAW